MNKIIKALSDIMQRLADIKIDSKEPFLILWLKSDLNANGISDYLENDQNE